MGLKFVINDNCLLTCLFDHLTRDETHDELILSLFEDLFVISLSGVGINRLALRNARNANSILGDDNNVSSTFDLVT